MKSSGALDFILAVLISEMIVNPLQAVPGDENWDDQFRIPGLNGIVYTAAVNGSDIYAGGSFTAAGSIPANHVAKWNGSGWSALGTGLDGDVEAIAISGSDLYVGGDFTHAGGAAAYHIAKWNGVSWSAVGSGLNGEVTSIAVSGSDVYAGGGFKSAGGVAAKNIARWNGSSWSSLGAGEWYSEGYSNAVQCIAVSGSDVYIGGYFTLAGGVPANHIAKWNGSSWSAMGSGFDFKIDAITIDGSNVYAGGYDYGSIVAVYKWNGSSWSDLDGDINYFQNYPITGFPSTQDVVVRTILVSGSNVYVGGHFLDPPWGGSISVWNGSSWSFVGDGVKGDVYTLSKQGSDIVAGGSFKSAGGIAAGNIAKWNGSLWAPLGAQNTPGGDILAMVSAGGSVYFGGVFRTAGGQVVNNIAKWNGSSWTALGTGTNGCVRAIAVYGTDIIAGGDFTMAGGIPANHIAKWNGSAWSALGDGFNVNVTAITVSGEDIYAGGFMILCGGPAAIARWNGVEWCTMGSLSSQISTMEWCRISSMIADGINLYVGGEFYYLFPSTVIRWDGSQWYSMGEGPEINVSSIVVHNSGIYAGGSNGVYSWNGISWDSVIEVGGGFVLETGDGPAPWEETFIYPQIFSMATDGDNLYIGGTFESANGTEAVNIARWDGNICSAVGSGINRYSFNYYPPFVYSLMANPTYLYVGGDFVGAGGKSSYNIARYSLNDIVSGTPIYPHLLSVSSPFGSVTSPSLGAAFGDYDGDRDADLIVANDGGANETLYRNDGESYSSVSLPPLTSSGKSTTGAAWADMDNDGDLDLYLSQLGSTGSLYRNDGGTYVSVTLMVDALNSFSSSWADYDEDGYADLFIAVRGGENRLYRNKGNGVFESITTGPVVTGTGQNMSGSWCDYDLDGDEDLFVARTGGENNRLFQNQGNGTFTEIITGSIVNDGGESWSGSWEDYNNDGWPDLYVANNGGVNFLYKNNKNGTFMKITTGDLVTEVHHSRSGGWVDIDNDGDTDLFVSNKDEENRWYMNMGGGNFRKYTIGTSNARGASFGDGDQDGDMDLFIVNDGEPNQFWSNGNSEINNWLEITCEGVTSNRSGIGARVKVKAVIKGISRWQTREIVNHTGFGGGSEMIAHFGLRGAVAADSLRIIWPSGTIWDTTSVAANQRLVIRERTTSPPVNHRPVAVNDSLTIPSGGSAVVHVLMNDSDPDGDPLCIEAVSTIGTAGSIQIDPGDTTLTYTASADYSGEDTYLYVISDDKGCLDTASVFVGVTAVNHPPIAVNDTLITRQDSVITMHILENDYDPDGDILYIAGIRNAICSCIVSVDDGDTTLTYRPPPGFSGEMAFGYILSDGNGGLDTASVIVTVEPATSVEKMSMIPDSYQLYQNHPNPFNPVTEIRYDLPKPCDVRLDIFDITGKRIASVVDQKKSAGLYGVQWNAFDINGHPVPTGVYFYRIEAGEFIQVRKMLLMR